MSDVLTIRSSGENPPIAILGVPFDNVSAAEAVDLTRRMVESRQPHHLVTANVDFLIQAQRDEELRRILFDAHLVLCGSVPLVWTSRLFGQPQPERVAGADLAPLLLRVAAQEKYRLFFLGTAPKAAAQALAKLQRQYSDVIVAGHYSPPDGTPPEGDHDEIARRIAAARPDLLFVAFGSPKQEKWIFAHYRALGVPVCLGVGATMDFLAAPVRRAPAWMQRTDTEWVYRMVMEPVRLSRRYLKGLWAFGRGIFTQWRQLRASPSLSRPQVSAPVHEGENWKCLKLPERLDLAAVRDDALLVDQVLADGRHCLLDLSDVKFVDSTGVGLFIRLQKKIHATGRQLILLAPSAAVIRALSLMHLQNFFVLAPDLSAARTLIETHAREEAAVKTPRAAAAVPLVWQDELTAANAEAAWERTQAHILAQAGSSKLVIDLSSLRFIDSSGVKVMVRARKLARDQGTELRFTAPPPAVRTVVRLAGLEDILLGETR